MEKKTNTRALIGIFLFCLGAQSTNVTLGILAYIMQAYSDVSPTVIQTVVVTPSLVGMIYGYFVGNLNRKISAKNLVIISQLGYFGMAMIFLLLGGSVSIYVLIAAAGLAGFAMGGNNTLLGLLMQNAVPDDNKRGALLGIFMSVMSVGGMILTTLGGVLAASRWQNAYLVFFYYIAAMILEFIFLPNTAPEGAVQPQAETARAEQVQSQSGSGMAKVWILSIHYLFFFMFLYVFGTNVSEYVINTYKLGTSVESGIAASCVSIGGIAAGALFGLYSTRWLKKLTVPVLMAVAAVGLIIPCVLTTNIMGIYLSGVLLGFSMMGCSPYIIGRLHDMVPEALYGKAMSIYSAFMNAGMLIAIYVITFLTQLVCGDGTNIHYKFVVAAVGTVICFITSLPIYLSKDGKEA